MTTTKPPVIVHAKKPKKAPSKPLSVKPVARIVHAKSIAQIEKDKRIQRLRECGSCRSSHRPIIR